MSDYPTNIAFGIDIGGSGIKGAPVDLLTGEFFAPRYRIATPQPATPQAVADTVAELVGHFNLDASIPIGIDFPAPIIHGVAPMIANLDKSWTGVDVRRLMRDRLGRSVTVVNDADAAGYAEVHYGAAEDRKGLVMVVTLGTGIGTVLVMNGTLIPNTELGHLEINGHDAESKAATSAFEREKLSYERWARRLQRYFSHVEMLFSPDVFIIGGGISKKADKFVPLLSTRAPIIPAELLNSAGIVGSALMAAQEDGAFDLTPEVRAQIRSNRDRIRAEARARSTSPLSEQPDLAYGIPAGETRADKAAAKKAEKAATKNAAKAAKKAAKAERKSSKDAKKATQRRVGKRD
ncbi:polyphosphate--glucose phosphotransferase [Changpingibacter yushuensis]|uniref:polyphosphate--glucose phosphotransferase n=1 Tax=Changpingibacter yushuensis TaxID=2758440 RepID=UPI0015F3C6F3|nr:ROK family protein [Changpingibacter yushuensis]